MTRQLYRIIRGTYSRRDGEPRVRMVDGKPVGKARPYVLYQAKSAINPDARDEVFMTDNEARAFGLQNLKRLIHRGVVTEITTTDEVKDPVDSKTGGETTPELSIEERMAALGEFIEKGEDLRSPGDIKKWREDIEASGLLTDVPKKKGDILDALRSATAE